MFIFNKEKILNIHIGYILIFIPLFINEFTLIFFSSDNYFEFQTVFTIRLFDIFCLSLGIITIYTRSTIIKVILITALFIACTNAAHVIFKYLVTNIAIRDSFYTENSVHSKGIGKGGQKYLNLVNFHTSSIISLDLNEILETFHKIKKINPYETNFKIEYEFIHYLDELSRKDNYFKKSNAIYISKNLIEFWNFSCDTHYSPFLVPSISGIVMIGGLPQKYGNTCYSHKFEHGYGDYYLKDKKSFKFELNDKDICLLAKENGFEKIIYFNKDFSNKVYKRNIKCNLLNDS